jgi:nucleoside-diphosphate-sugar epimerase
LEEEAMERVFVTGGPGDRSIPRWLARTVAALTGWMKQPPVTRTAIALGGQEVTVNDAKARRELGYTSHVTRESGLAEMQSGRQRQAHGT